MGEKISLRIGEVYEVKGYPQPFEKNVYARYIGKNKEGHYFIEENKSLIFAVDSFLKLEGVTVSMESVSSHSIIKIDLEKAKENSKLLKILENLGKK